ncbi:hypothetical protein QQS21_004614 [Conoideocrella luteorostrata]|uniref:Uncharacterized protein n=1 Tax=Conoideocrella luteorostrata TaxID=1105319 RepID=A0AAJ0FZP7_9HYPO|nr:hypothetical protein QQS21_004614 [Conoideocrella luteorostrata]
MQHVHLVSLVVLSILAWPCSAPSATPQEDWEFPRGPDLASILKLGANYSISWKSNLKTWFPYYCSACNAQQVDLWITGGAPGNPDKHKLGSNINVVTTFAFSWTCTLPAVEVANESSWVFRFLPSGVSPDSTTQQISSSIFVIVNTSSSTSAATSSTTKSIDSTAKVTTTSSVPTTSSYAAAQPSITEGTASSSLGVGAVAGISVSMTAVFAAILVLMFLVVWRFIRHRRRRLHDAARSGLIAPGSNTAGQSAFELQGNHRHVTEIGS